MDDLHLKVFQGGYGRGRLIDALQTQALVRDEDLAIEIAKRVKVEEVPTGATLISQGASDTDLFFILNGEFSIVETAARSRKKMPANRLVKWRSSIRSGADSHR